MQAFREASPLKILEGSTHRGLGPGDLGVLIARAGVGKTAFLIHVAYDTLLRKEKLVHVTLEDLPEKITSYYHVILSDLIHAFNADNEAEIRGVVEENRMILAYLNQSFEIKRLRENLQNLVAMVGFKPQTIIVDGLDFEKAGREVLERLKDIAEEFGVGIWLSALSHRHITQVNAKGIPFPCHEVDDIFSVIMQLQPTESGVTLRLLKDRERRPLTDATLKLDPKTFLIDK